MAIAVTCTSCRSTFRVNAAHAGKRGRCPHCRTFLDVPAEDAPPLPPPEPGAPVDSNRLMREILDAFQGNIAPVRVTLAYRVGVLLVTAAMLLLPLLYLGLIAGVVFLLYLHVTMGAELVGHVRSLWGVLFLYAGPLVAGVIMLFFLVKPLFAGRARAHKLRTLEFGQEPLLFALVTRVARAVGAPEPKRIELDCQVNASASFGGGLGMLFGRELVLTIGLPLVAGLSARQLAGVLAHELGHFSQGTGMRLSGVVRSVNAWFYRVVYERDDWDAALVNWSEEGERLVIVFLFARFCVWLTRGVLWLFLMTGHALSCFLMRQMEYDADRYEARLAGGDAFAETSRRLLVLNLAADHALGLAGESWSRSRRLPDDLCALGAAVAEHFPPKVLRKIEKAMAKAKSGLFDTHPAYGERLASVRREKAPGVFRLDGPATRLFADFPRLARAVTRDFYKQVFGKRTKSAEVVPVETFLLSSGGDDEEL